MVNFEDCKNGGTVCILGVTLSLKDLRRLWLQSIVLSDTQVGRDKGMRFWQYLARMLSGLSGSQVSMNLCSTLALGRKTIRFWKPVKLVKQMEDCLASRADSVDKTLTLTEYGSFFVYCLIDHCAFAQRIGLLKLSPESSDRLDRFEECWWFTEALALFLRERRALGSDDPRRRREAKLLVVKAFLDIWCAVYFILPAAKRNLRIHKSWAGLFGAIASLISLHMAWPRDKCLED